MVASPLEWIRAFPPGGVVVEDGKGSSGRLVVAAYDRASTSAQALGSPGPSSSAFSNGSGLGAPPRRMRFSDADVGNYLPGRNFDPIRSCYNVGNLVGAGSFSVVRIARDLSTKERVAVKVFSQKTKRATIVNELRILQSLDHPNVLKYREHFEEDGQFLLITEYLEGQDLLSSVVDRGSYPEEDAKTVIVQILLALAHFHSRGVAHRDLKLENVMLCSELDSTTLKIIDFGLAGCVTEERQHLSEVCGTPSYAAPEVLQRNAQYDTQCDVWAVGVMLFMMLCGEPPFQAKTLPQLVKTVRTGVYSFDDPAWELVSEDAKNLVDMLLTADPAKRPTAEQALQHPWLQQ